MLAEEKLVNLLKEKGLTVATAESCTGGLISKRITDVSGSSEVFNCGIVSYSNEIKERILGVSADSLKNYGAVSEQIVREMVTGLLKLSGDDIAVAVSGIAGPNSDSSDKPVGLIYLAVGDKNKTIVRKLNNNFTDNVRENNRQSAADNALSMLIEFIG